MEPNALLWVVIAVVVGAVALAALALVEKRRAQKRAIEQQVDDDIPADDELPADVTEEVAKYHLTLADGSPICRLPAVGPAYCQHADAKVASVTAEQVMQLLKDEPEGVVVFVAPGVCPACTEEATDEA